MCAISAALLTGSLHCTMWLSIALELSKVFFKVIGLPLLIFGQNLCWCKIVYILQENIFFRKCDKNMFLKKNMKGWKSKPEIFHEDKTHESKKMSQNSFFTIPALHGENVI